MARQLHFEKIETSPTETAEGLREKISIQTKKIIYVRGNWTQIDLKNASTFLEEWIAYERFPDPLSEKKLLHLMRSQPWGMALFSQRTASWFLKFANKHIKILKRVHLFT